VTPDHGRGQASLLAVGVALVVLTGVVAFGLFVADGALDGATRDPGERATAVGVADRLVAADGPLATRANVLNESALARLDGDALATAVPATADADVRVALDGATVAERGTVDGGTTVRRVVLVADRSERTLEPSFATGGEHAVTLPRRTDRIRLTVTPPNGTTVRTVRVNGRVVLHDPDGIDGTLTVPVSRYETATVRVNATGPLPAGSLRLGFYPETTRKAVLAVTVDD
jgi:hypothetical protein